jgi:hypothetical protein
MTGASSTHELEAECRRIVALLHGKPPRRGSVGSLPDSAGIYTVWIASKKGLKDLGLQDQPEEPPLIGRPLYVGKDEASIRKRLQKHFTPRDTGHSTLRRTLASLLDLESRPRRTRIDHPTEKQLRTLVSNFDLTEVDDERLSHWMCLHLEVCAAPSAFTPLRHLERAVGASLHPPLDQERLPMWTPNPWRDQVKAARCRLRDRARATL